MARYNQNLRTTSVSLIFLLLIQISGCVSSKVIVSYSDLPESGRYIHIINTQNLKYLVEDIVLSEGILSGKIMSNESAHLGKKISIYLPADSSIKISPKMIISFPIKDITKVEIKEYSTWKTIGLVVALVPVIGGIYFIVSGGLNLEL